VVEQHRHADAVSFGGWAIDLHPPDGVYSPLSPCTQWHSKGIYQIPYRCMYSRNVENLFLTGRIISASHVAFGSTRVMATCGHNAQAVGMAAAVCHEQGLMPRDLLEPGRMPHLQQRLLIVGQYIPGAILKDPDDVVRQAALRASSRFVLSELPPDGQTVPLDTSRAMLIPVAAGPLPAVRFLVDTEGPVLLDAEVRGSSVEGNFTPDVVLHQETVELAAGGGQELWIRPNVPAARSAYFAYCLGRNAAAAVHTSKLRVTGVLSLAQSMNRAVAKSERQEPPPGIGIDAFEFWLPSRRPAGRNLAIQVDPPLEGFGAENVRSGIARPTTQPNAWVAAPTDAAPRLTACWASPQRIGRIELGFDTDFDHPMESVLIGHPEREIPFCVKRYRVLDAEGAVLFECRENHQTRNTIRLEPAVATRELHIEILETHGAPAALFEARFYES
jgi:hypothetical protein